MYTITKEQRSQPVVSTPQPSNYKGGQSIKTGALSLLGKVGDFLSRGNYASASAVKSAVSGGSAKDILASAWQGLKGQQKTTYSDVLDKLGWKAGTGNMANRVARGLVSFTGDVLLDPTTYLTAGTGAGAKLVTKEGTTVLTKQGTKQLTKLALQKEATGLTQKAARTAAEDMFSKALEQSPETALKYIDKGGIKFAGKTLAGTTALNRIVNPINVSLGKAMSPLDKVVNKVVAEPIQKVVNSISNIKEVKAVVDKIGSTFNRDWLIKDKPLLQRVVQEGRDKSAGLIQQMDETVTKNIAKFTQQEKENVGRALWSKDTSTLTPREAELNNYIQENYAKYFQEEKARGLTKGEIEGEYLNQMYKNPEVLQREMKNPQFVKGNVLKVDPFTKERSVKSLEQAERLGLEPIFDVEKLLKARLSQSIKTTTDHDMLKNVLDLEGIASKTAKVTEKPLTKKQLAYQMQHPEAFKLPNIKQTTEVNKELGADMVPASSVPGLSKIKGAENVHIPSTTAKYLESIAPKVVDQNSALQTALRHYDNFTNMFKKNVLSLFPAYHARNFRGNIFQTILEYGVMDAANPLYHSNAIKVLRGADSKELVKIGGRNYSVGELRKIMQENGILQGKGFFDIANPLKKDENILFSSGQRAASAIENEARAATFLMGLEHNGGDIVSAAERTKKTLFDYDNLSNTEKEVIKRVFPFWTWTRKAAESTLSGLVKNPGKMSEIFKIMNNAQKSSFEGISDEERATLPDYLQNQFVFKVKGSDGVVRYKSGMGTPIESITGLFTNPTGTASFSLNPAIKALFTVVTKYDLDSGKPLAEVTTKNAQIFKSMPKPIQNMVGYGEVKKTDGTTLSTASPFALYILRQPPFSRYVSTAGVLTNEGKNLSTKTMQTLFGINATNVDIEKQVKQYENKYKDEITAPLRQKGIIVKNEYGNYYIPKDIVLSAEERAAALEVLKTTKNVNYAPKIDNALTVQNYTAKTAPVSKSATKTINKVSSKAEAVKKMQAKKNSPKTVNAAVRSIQDRINL